MRKARLTRTSRITISLAVVLGLVIPMGVGLAVADVNITDRDPHPLRMPQITTPMTVNDSLYIAKQLKPVRKHLPQKMGEKKHASELFTSTKGVDKWYEHSTASLRKYALGGVVKKRQSPVKYLTFPGAETTQYAFRTTDSQGYPVLGTATLVVPLVTRPKARIFVWAHPLNSAGAHCILGTQMQKGITSVVNVTTSFLEAVLAQGHPVLIPDATGIENAYVMNRLASHITLDSMRMVRQQRDYKKLHEMDFVLAGLSHGALTMGYVAVEQPDYAPELTPAIKQIIVHEGAPDLLKLGHHFGFYGDTAERPSIYTGFLVAYLIGMVREYPVALRHVEEWLTDEGKQAIKTSRNMCGTVNLSVGLGRKVPDYFKKGFFTSRTFRTIMQITKDNSAIYYPGVPSVPVLLVHGTGDLILYQAREDELLHRRWCAANVNSVYQRIPLGMHFTTPPVSQPRVYLTTFAALNGVEQKPHCPDPVLL